MTLDNKNNDRRTQMAFIPHRRHIHSGKAPGGVRKPGFGLVFGPRCWSPGSQPQYIVPHRGEFVTAPNLCSGKAAPSLIYVTWMNLHQSMLLIISSESIDRYVYDSLYKQNHRGVLV